MTGGTTETQAMTARILPESAGEIVLTLPQDDALLLLRAVMRGQSDVGEGWDQSVELGRLAHVIQHAFGDHRDLDQHELIDRAGHPTAYEPLTAAERSAPTVRWATLIESSDDGRRWHAATLAAIQSSGLEETREQSATQVARRLMVRAASALWAARDTVDWDDLWFRVVVWDLDRADTLSGAYFPAGTIPTEPEVVGTWLAANTFVPHAVETRTPSQMDHEISRSRLWPQRQS
ncbi:hypothetical protein [Actinokineospora sp.]|uniref:hypothetical protein n=1 Tax=Actinokineospora sp. TaxID=1872133 RepID=UPI0040382F4E